MDTQLIEYLRQFVTEERWEKFEEIINYRTKHVLGLQNLNAQCLVSINPSNPPTICSGDSLILVSNGSLQNSSWSWSPAIGLNTTTGDTVIASPTATTTYIVTRSCYSSQR